MAKVFIAYRRQDSSHISGRIYDRLCQRYGKRSIFKDVDSIPPGEDFRTYISKGVLASDVFLLLIGDQWLTCLDQAGGRRIDSETDYLRTEIEVAISGNIPIIPLLVGNAGMPQASELPPSIRTLAFRNAIYIRPDPDFHRDVARLIETVSAACIPRRGLGHLWKRWWVKALAVAAVAALLAVAYYFWRPPPPHPKLPRFFVTRVYFADNPEKNGIPSIVIVMNDSLDPSTVTQESAQLYDTDGRHIALSAAAMGSRLFLYPEVALAPGTSYQLDLAKDLRSLANQGIVADSLSPVPGASIRITTRKLETSAKPPPAGQAHASKATLDVLSSVPPGTQGTLEIEIDGEKAGRAPVRSISLDAGRTHRVVVWGTHVSSGFRLRLIERTVAPGEGAQVVVDDPIPPFGSISIASNPTGHVLIDGKDGRLMTPVGGYVLFAGHHTIEILPTSEDADRYAPVRSEFELQPWTWGQRLGPFTLPRR
jgi:hypothetical protein